MLAIVMVISVWAQNPLKTVFGILRSRCVISVILRLRADLCQLRTDLGGLRLMSQAAEKLVGAFPTLTRLCGAASLRVGCARVPQVLRLPGQVASRVMDDGRLLEQ